MNGDQRTMWEHRNVDTSGRFLPFLSPLLTDSTAPKAVVLVLVLAVVK